MGVCFLGFLVVALFSQMVVYEDMPFSGSFAILSQLRRGGEMLVHGTCLQFAFVAQKPHDLVTLFPFRQQTALCGAATMSPPQLPGPLRHMKRV